MPLGWKQIFALEDVLDLKERGTLLDFVVYRSPVGEATIVYFRDRQVKLRVEPVLKVVSTAEYAGFDGVRVEQNIEKVRKFLSIIDWLEEIK